LNFYSKSRSDDDLKTLGLALARLENQKLPLVVVYYRQLGMSTPPQENAKMAYTMPCRAKQQTEPTAGLRPHE
jgi:hypothetical protein